MNAKNDFFSHLYSVPFEKSLMQNIFKKGFQKKISYREQFLTQPFKKKFISLLNIIVNIIIIPYGNIMAPPNLHHRKYLSAIVVQLMLTLCICVVQLTFTASIKIPS